MANRKQPRPARQPAHSPTPPPPPRRPDQPGQRRQWLLAAGILCAGLLLAWCKINVPLNYDEAATIEYYATKPYAFIATDYRVPNNHIGYSLLLHTWSLLIHDPRMIRPDTAILRLPSLMLFTLGAAAFFLACRRLLAASPVTAAAATTFFIAQPFVLDYALRLRGYGPSAAWLCCALALVAWHERLARWLFALLLAGALFMFNYTLPSNLWYSLPLALGIALWPVALGLGWFAAPEEKSPSNPPAAPPLRRIMANRQAAAGWFAAALGIGFAASALAYLPIREQLAQAAQAPHSVGAMLHSLAAQGPKHAGRAIAANPYFYSPWLTGAMILAGLAALAAAARRGEAEARRAAALLAPTLLLFPLVAGLLSPTGYERNYMVLAPVVALTCAWGLKEGTRLASGILTRTGRVSASAPWLKAAFPALLLLIASGHAIQHLASYSRDFMPDRIAHYVAQNYPATLLLFGWDADPSALHYYTAVEHAEKSSIYYEYMPKDLLDRAPRFLVLGGEQECRKILDFFNISPGPRYTLQPVASFGKLNLLLVSVNQAAAK